jgi:hypothetical protein
MEIDAIFRTEVENRKFTCHGRGYWFVGRDSSSNSGWESAMKDLPTMMALLSHVN